MKEFEVRKLFLDIGQFYSSFVWDDYKVARWHQLLNQVPLKLAKRNLERYAMNPDNQFAPHPGVLAETPSTSAGGPAIPNAEETRRMLLEMDKRALMPPAPIPESYREAVNRLAADSAYSRHDRTPNAGEH